MSELISRARRMTYERFNLSLSQNEYRTITANSTTLIFWQKAQVAR